MNLFLALALLLFPALCTAAQEATPSPVAPPGVADDSRPAPELLDLEKTLAQKQAEKTSGRMTPEQYQDFVTRFRPMLEETAARVAPTPINQSLHSRILLRLGDANDALANVNAVLKKNPEDPELLAAKGFILYDQKNFAGSAAAANAALQKDPNNQNALWLKHMSEERRPAALRLPGSPWETSTGAGVQGFGGAATDDAGKPYVLPVKAGKSAPPPSPNLYYAATATSGHNSPTPSPAPLIPLAGALGASVAAYGVLRSKETWASADGLNPSPEISPENRARALRGSLIFVGTFALTFGALEFGPEVIPSGLAIIRNGVQPVTNSFQKWAGSEAGAILPAETPAAGEAAVANSANVLEGFTATESQVINETQGILRSPQFAQIQTAYKAGQPVTVTIGGRVIQYEPNMPASGMSFFGDKGFYIGPQAFKSSVELQKTILHELYRLATSQSANGVSGELAAEETRDAQAFADKAITVFNHGK